MFKEHYSGSLAFCVQHQALGRHSVNAWGMNESKDFGVTETFLKFNIQILDNQFTLNYLNYNSYSSFYNKKIHKQFQMLELYTLDEPSALESLPLFSL